MTSPRLTALTVALVVGACVLLGCMDRGPVPTMAPFDQVYSAYEVDRQAAVRALGPKVTYAAAKQATAYVLKVWSAAMHGLEAVAQLERLGEDPTHAYCAARASWNERGVHTSDERCSFERCWNRK